LPTSDTGNVWFLGGREWNQREPDETDSDLNNEHLAIRRSDSKVRRPFLICAESDDGSEKTKKDDRRRVDVVSKGKIQLRLGIPTEYFAEASTPKCTEKDYSFPGYADARTGNPLPHLSSLFIRNTQLLELRVPDVPAPKERPNEAGLRPVPKNSLAPAWDSLLVLVFNALGYGSTEFSRRLHEFRAKTRRSDLDLLPPDSARFSMSAAFKEKRKHFVGQVLQKQDLFSVLDAKNQGKKLDDTVVKTELEKLGQSFSREEIYHLFCILMTNQHAHPSSVVERMNHSSQQLSDQEDSDTRIHFPMLFGARLAPKWALRNLEKL